MGASGGEEKEISANRRRGARNETRRAKFEKRRGRQDAVIVPRSLHPGEAHGTHKTRSATPEGAVAAVGMTIGYCGGKTNRRPRHWESYQSSVVSSEFRRREPQGPGTHFVPGAPGSESAEKGKEKKTQERFIAQKTCDGKTYLATQTPLGMTGGEGRAPRVERKKAQPSRGGRRLGEVAGRVVEAASYLVWMKWPRRFC